MPWHELWARWRLLQQGGAEAAEHASDERWEQAKARTHESAQRMLGMRTRGAH